MWYSSDTRYHCDPSVSFLIAATQKVPTCVYPTSLVNWEGSLRETLPLLLYFQQRNNARNAPFPFWVCVSTCTCVHEVIVLEKNSVTGSFSFIDQQQPEASLCFVSSCEHSSPSVLSRRATSRGFGSWNRAGGS